MNERLILKHRKVANSGGYASFNGVTHEEIKEGYTTHGKDSKKMRKAV